ncbi:7006_t:CDS:2 [Ambispora leptoticha]|uniref:7006_t:CDS:1 n=1 Tax=Ambispora leptoticha TaxID=144679 RepID=A0A9N9CQ89_9GLOM|nr:7006_t:CDS:2 [Ambispora leptoticha]
MSNELYLGQAALVAYLNSKDPSNWSFFDFLSSNFEVIVNSPPDTNDIKGLAGTWLKRYKLEVEAIGHQVYKIARQQNVAILKSKAKIIADEQGINLVGASCGFYGPEIIAEYSHIQPNPKRDLNDDEHIESDRFLKKKRSADDYGSTPPNKIRTINEGSSQRKRYDSDSPPRDEDYFSSDSDSEIVPVSLTNVFLATSIEHERNLDQTAELDTSLISTKEAEVKSRKSRRPYITRDIAEEVLKKYQMCVLAGKKLTYNDVDVLDFVRSNMNKDKATKSPLCIGVINVHNPDCTKFLPDDFKRFIANQLQDQDSEIKAVCFATEQSIDKFVVDCEEEVLQFLEKFSDIGDLESLARCLNENPIDMSNASNDLIFVRTLFDHFFFLYKNDILLQPMSESELNAYVWTPLLRNAFLGKDDMKLSCGELASKSYEKLKEILNIAGRSAPKLDGKGFLKSLGTEILAQEDGVLNTHSKRTGDLRKLEYCSKVILTTLFFALPSAAKADITKIETYNLQSNGFHLKISASKYLFEDTIVTMDLQHVEVPRTVEGFSKLVVGAKTILSWKARTKNNTMTFYEALRKGHKRLTNGAFFSPIKISV